MMLYQAFQTRASCAYISVYIFLQVRKLVSNLIHQYQLQAQSSLQPDGVPSPTEVESPKAPASEGAARVRAEGLSTVRQSTESRFSSSSVENDTDNDMDAALRDLERELGRRICNALPCTSCLGTACTGTVHTGTAQARPASPCAVITMTVTFITLARLLSAGGSGSTDGSGQGPSNLRGSTVSLDALSREASFCIADRPLSSNTTGSSASRLTTTSSSPALAQLGDRDREQPAKSRFAQVRGSDASKACSHLWIRNAVSPLCTHLHMGLKIVVFCYMCLRTGMLHC